MTKKELLNKLTNSEELTAIAFIPVSEVIKWVDELEEEKYENLGELVDVIVDEISNMGTEIFDDYDLELHYHEVEISDVTINSNGIEKAVKRALDSFKNNN